MVKNFTKADLKYGYLVVLRDGTKALFMPSEHRNGLDFCNGAEHISIESYKETLLNKYSSNFDIVKVYGYDRSIYNATELKENSRELIWERKEAKRMTVEQMREELEKLTGETIEVIESFDYNNTWKEVVKYCNSIDDCHDCYFDDDCPRSFIFAKNASSIATRNCREGKDVTETESRE